MDILDLMRQRHSVRQYEQKRIENDKRKVLDLLAEEINRESGMHIQVIYDEPKCFGSIMAHYCSFNGCSNYIAVVGPNDRSLDEKAGYYGERLVLKAQELGLNSCWVAVTHGKTTAVIGKGESLAIVISLGYGKTQGVPHRSRAATEVSDVDASSPQWYKDGIEAALLAPTGLNQQRFMFRRNGEQVTASLTRGFCSGVDLGIVKYHFEAASGHKVD